MGLRFLFGFRFFPPSLFFFLSGGEGAKSGCAFRKLKKNSFRNTTVKVTKHREA